MKHITYTGKSKVIIRLCEAVNELINNGGGGTGSSVTYTISVTGHTLTLKGSDGSKSTIDLPDDSYDDTTIKSAIATINGLLNGHSVKADVPADAVFTDTTYKLEKSADGLSIVLRGSDNSESSVTGAVGEKGEKGDKGDTGSTGATGASAYDIAVSSGFTGTEAEWLASLKGDKGDKGDASSISTFYIVGDEIAD